jgi:hypothetical protein
MQQYITTISDFRTYIRERLGLGVINVELTTQQLDNAMYDAFYEFTRYMYGEGTHFSHVALSLKEGVSQYNCSATSIQDVMKITIGTYYGNINNLFSPTNLIFQGKFSLYNLDMQGYYTSMMYLKTVDEMFGLHYTGYYNANTKILTITPTPRTDVVALMETFKTESLINLFNHPLVRKLSVAYAKKTWKLITGKYGGMQLPGGGTVTSDFIGDVDTEIEKIIEEIKNEGEPPLFFMA